MNKMDDYYAALDRFWSDHFDDLKEIFDEFGLELPNDSIKILKELDGMFNKEVIRKMVGWDSITDSDISMFVTLSVRSCFLCGDSIKPGGRYSVITDRELKDSVTACLKCTKEFCEEHRIMFDIPASSEVR
jgi:hypothetical protein